jgi:hypothetical protein
MPRPLRFIPEKSLVEITTRTLQGRLLLKPSPELTDLILGVIGKAQTLYGMTIHAFVFLSTHVPRRFEGVFFVREALPDIPSASHRARWPTGAGRFGAFAGHLRARLGTAGKC